MKIKIKNLKFKTLNLLIFVSLTNIFISCDEKKDNIKTNRFKYSVESIEIISGDEGSLAAPAWEGGTIKEYEFNADVPMGLEIDPKTGSLSWKGKIIPGKYDICIHNKNSDNVVCLIFNVKLPKFQYLNKNYYGIRKKMDTTDTPKIIDGLKDGEFKINSTKNSDITIDKITGKITWSDNLPIDLYTLFISNTNSRFLDTLYLDINYEIISLSNKEKNGEKLNNPNRIALDKKGNVYIADVWPNKIKKISETGELITIAGNDNENSIDGDGINASFSYIYDILFSPNGNLYILEINKVRIMTPDGKVSTLNCCKNIPTFTSLLIDEKENLYIASKTSSASIIMIRKYNDDPLVSDSVLLLKKNNTYDDGIEDGLIFKEITKMKFDKDGNIYVCDGITNVISKISREGIVTSIAGKKVNIPNNRGDFKNGIKSEARFTKPSGLAFDSKGNLFITDYLNNMIRKINKDGVVSTFAGPEEIVNPKIPENQQIYYIFFSYNAGLINGHLKFAKFYEPSDIDIDSKDNIYLTEWSNQSIRKIIIE